MFSDDIELAGASPETLVKLEDKKLTTFPLAGTRPRGKTREEDQKLEAGVRMAEKLIDSGAALKKLNEFIACSNE
ncbi:chorismate-binding protein [Blautia intestinalis]|uniref:chorismate-binding protein n=1 Tax=Blautia intestinalis TaxID=2763028 RepID=UPI002FE6E20E